METAAALAAYAFVMTVTPGPNNLLLMSSGLIFGLRRTGWHLAGVTTGVVLQIWATGIGLGVLFAMEPRLQVMLKLAGSLYMLWLASRLWRSGELREAGTAKPITFLQALGFQFVNPKSWLMATTVVAVFAPAGEGYAGRLLVVSMLFAAVALPCTTVWAVCGAGLRTWLHAPNAVLYVNRVMAVLAALTIVLFWR